ncbi:bifunctional (p)ppGpp synthetase/guanosine-3',5'-bis(diphosphate) 3'-pyrophosphohydrolase [Roseococcus sp. SYP-B2431]|uniref:RelA/SpoT family protein n=1 Tax=Roseococcus sp. SYP-B2431 TaxID=2496640 RepID=UPI0010400188|nr:bifunctional (p)ppGpp synthetase/guanosine-3',5'-bis(diphosphate) 3'-pyrophosphohydrolase [Roseococcus sp. SYP-B2431]TCH96445.1 bifunctional (p)ppGpp synthetase/guanosine-3',5'-bis(diphosphate) 3'-pyrophosphohydrolase [Roseococcus sp. SYP-B2431]
MIPRATPGDPAVARAPEGLANGGLATGAAAPGLDVVLEFCSRITAADPRLDADLILRAGRFAAEAHAQQKRQNGEPYIIHPVAVAEILAGYRLDTATIATALLHDVVEDTEYKLPEIERRFGPEIARLVDGVTKLSRIEVQSERTKQAENLRKLLLALSEDLRVLLVKLADRLHNMRTLNFVTKPESRHRTARETLDIYAPLAERIGIEGMKIELETLGFRELHPDAWATIAQRLTYLRGRSADIIPDIEQELREALEMNGVPVEEVLGREKSPYSIWRKMQAKNVAFEGLSDVMAFRIIVPERAQCYLALGAIHDAFKVIAGRFKDYISTPKTNGYQSLHTGVLLPGRRDEAKIEVQIRTREMHHIAEFGLAAHWIYKQGGEAAPARSFPWVRALIDILENEPEANEAMESTKLELHRELVFCFSPKGDLIELPRDATPVDFAYHVHSQVGDACVGAKVNGRIVRLHDKLENGDQVEIITAKGGQPNPAWLKFVKSGKAQARIRRFAQAEEKQKQRDEGRTAIVKMFRQNGLEFTEKLLEPAVKALRQSGVEELYHAVASGSISARDVVHAAFPELRAPQRAAEPMALVAGRARLGRGSGLKQASVPAAPITGVVAGMQLHFAQCCHPIPGDQIVGIVTTGKGVTIHTQDCHMLENFSATPERFLDVDWEQGALGPATHVVRLAVAAVNGQGLLSGVANAISKQKAVLTNLRLGRREDDECDLNIDVEVRDTRHLAELMGTLRACEGVIRVDRARS